MMSSLPLFFFFFSLSITLWRDPESCMQILFLYTEVRGLLLLLFFHKTSQKLKIAILPSGKVGDNLSMQEDKLAEWQYSSLLW